MPHRVPVTSLSTNKDASRLIIAAEMNLDALTYPLPLEANNSAASMTGNIPEGVMGTELGTLQLRVDKVGVRREWHARTFFQKLRVFTTKHRGCSRARPLVEKPFRLGVGVVWTMSWDKMIMETILDMRGHIGAAVQTVGVCVVLGEEEFGLDYIHIRVDFEIVGWAYRGR